MIFDKNEINKILAEILELDDKDITGLTEDDNLQEKRFNSISAIKFIVRLEEKYDFELRDEDLLFDKFNTLNKLYKLLEKY